MLDYDENYLEHYGRKGMKWYRHIFGKEQNHAKYNVSGNIYSNEKMSKEKYLEKLRNTRSAKTAYKHREDLTTKELQDILNRINTEKKLKELSNSKSVNVGQKFIKKLISIGATANSLISLYNSPSGKMVRRVLKMLTRYFL